MKNDLTCEVVQDLLPSYLDGLTSEITKEAIEEHMKTCEMCRNMLDGMKEPYGFSEEEQKKDIDFLKKTRKKTRMRIFAGVIAAILIILGLVLMNSYFLGKKVDNPELIEADVNVTNNRIVISGKLTDLGKGVSDVRFENKDGVVQITVFQTLKSSFHSNGFYADYENKQLISQIRLSNRIIWDNGDSIDKEVAELYESKHLYIGDMPANGASANALGIWKDLGNYTNELQTTKEPYGWKLIREQDYAPEIKTKIESQMRSYGSALIAVIDNLGYVTFEYSIDGIAHSLTVKESDADAMAGQSVKKMANTPCGLQELMKILNLTRGYAGSRFNNYVQDSDGKWECNGIKYNHRVVLTGRDPGAQADGRFVVLTNDADVTYAEVSKSLYSSNMNDFLDPEKTVIVEMGGN